MADLEERKQLGNAYQNARQSGRNRVRSHLDGCLPPLSRLEGYSLQEKASHGDIDLEVRQLWIPRGYFREHEIKQFQDLAQELVDTQLKRQRERGTAVFDNQGRGLDLKLGHILHFLPRMINVAETAS